MRAADHARQNLVGYLALFVALGGTSYAAVQLPNESVGAAQIKDGGVRTAEVGDGSLLTRDLSPSARKALAGNDGATGSDGAKGATGSAGAAGATGSAGAKGDAESAGATGSAGIQGESGVQGEIGVQGDSGLKGDTGEPGQPGSDAPADYGYVYSESAQTVDAGQVVQFDNQIGGNASVSLMPGTGEVTVAHSGIYEVQFSVTGLDANQFAIYVNGSLVPGSTYGSSTTADRVQTNGQTMLVMVGGEVVTLRNRSGLYDESLPLMTGGTETNVNASLIIRSLPIAN